MSLVAGVAVVALAGFMSLSYEILWFRVFSFTTRSSPVVFGLILGAYLAGLAAGALLARQIVISSARLDAPRQLRVVAGSLVGAALAGYAVVPGLAALATHGAWSAGLLLVLVAATMFGIVLPLVSHLGIAPDDAVGVRLSYLYLGNIVGSALGSLVTGFVLTDLWSVAAIARALATGGLILGASVAVAAERKSNASSTRRRVRAATVSGLLGLGVVAVLGASSTLFDRLYERLLYKDASRGQPRFAEVVETRAGIITVTPGLLVYGGGVYDGAISTDLFADRNYIVRAYALAALHPHPSHVLEVGLSTGAWARVLVSLPGVERLTSVEIDRGYLRIIERHAEVRDLLHDPRVQIVIDDGRRWLSRHPDERFDAIVMNTSFHWRAHATNLLSAEFMRLAQTHLRPGGVLYFNSTDSPDAMKTALTTFPYGLRCLNFIAVSDAPLAFDRQRWTSLIRTLRRDDGGPVFPPGDPRAAARLDTLEMLATSLDRPPLPYGLESRASVLRRVAAAGIITDDNMLSEWRGTPFGPPALIP